MNTRHAIANQAARAIAKAIPRGGPAWGTLLTLAIGMTLALCAAAAQRGINAAAVAPEHQHLRVVGRTIPQQNDANSEPAPMAPADLMAWRADPAFAALEAADRTLAIIGIADQNERLTLWRITQDLPAILGIANPIAGRWPAPPDETTTLEIAISTTLALRSFANHDDAINQPCTVDGVPAIIAAVVPDPPGDAFAGIQAWTMLSASELRQPIAFDERDESLFTLPYLTGFARLSGEPIATHTQPPVVAALPAVVLGPRIPLVLRASLIAACLLLAASLVASAMLFATSLLRDREELALRLAMGSTRASLMLELAGRAVIISALAAALASLATWWAVDLARTALLGTLPGASGLALNAIAPRWLLAMGLLAVGALTIAASIVTLPIRPAWCVRGLPGLRRTRWNRFDDATVALHAMLATGTLAIAFTLTTLAGRASAPPEGLSVERIGVMTIALPWWQIPDDNERWRIAREILDTIETLQRFESVAAADNAPIVGPDFRAIPVRALNGTNQSHAADTIVLARLRSATAEAIPLLGITEERRLTEQAATTLLRLYETDFPPLPATISRTLATQLFGDPARALGMPIELGEQRVPAIVLRIVADAADGPNAFDPGGPSLWLPMPIGWESPTWSLLVRLPPGDSPIDRESADERLREIVRTIAPEAAADHLLWLDRRITERARIYTSGASIAAAAGIASLVLAALAAVARTRFTVAARMDELRLLAAFGHGLAAMTARAVLPAIGGTLVGAGVAAIASPWITHQLIPLEEPAPLSAAFLPAFIVLLGCSFAAVAAARTARIDAAALFRTL